MACMTPTDAPTTATATASFYYRERTTILPEAIGISRPAIQLPDASRAMLNPPPGRLTPVLHAHAPGIAPRNLVLSPGYPGSITRASPLGLAGAQDKEPVQQAGGGARRGG